ncbi:MAG: RDD family protein [Microbacteriaceae bacterium]|nr:RDD family protein [Nocardioidaceae bacterium]MCL2796415.1 RDD family protein [Microbacteriaceae bacterium]
MSQIPAGWYPDPAAPPSNPQQRYWDGQGWTTHTAPTAYGAQGAVRRQADPAAYGAIRAQMYNPYPTTPDGQVLSGWWWRVLAQMIDGVIMAVPSFVVTIPIQIHQQPRLNALTQKLQGPNPDFSGYWHGYMDLLRDQMLATLPLAVLACAYYVIMWRWKGATVGQLAVGLRVRLREAPGPVPWGAALRRALVFSGAGILPYIFLAIGLWPVALVLLLVAGIFNLLNVLWPLWDSKRQALHDKAAGTNVVKVR